MPKLTEPQRLALVASLALTIGAGATAAFDRDPRKPTLPEVAQVASTKLDPALVVDTAKYHAAIVAAKQAHGGDLVDLLSPPVEPGQNVTTGGNFPRGARLAEVALTVEGFSSPTWTCRDDDDATWCEVTATNTSAQAQRLMAMVRVSQ
jgi:hypothetical protein